MSARARRVGDVTVTRVEEMCGPGFDPVTLFPDWRPEVLDEHRAWMVPTCYDPDRAVFIASVHTWVVRTAHHTILIDSCTGNGKERPAFPRFHRLDIPFLARLEAAGVRPEDVDYVLCTHLHVDHCGWNTRLIDGRWVPTFPNAKYVFSRAEYAFCASPEMREGFNAGVYEDSVLPVVEAGQALIVDGPYELGDGLFLEPAPGHTPGQVVVRLVSRGEEALFSADVMHQPIQVYEPAWNSRFCALPEAARATRLRILAHCAEHGATLFPAHFAGSFAGRVRERPGGFAWDFT